MRVQLKDMFVPNNEFVNIFILGGCIVKRCANGKCREKVYMRALWMAHTSASAQGARDTCEEGAQRYPGQCATTLVYRVLAHPTVAFGKPLYICLLT